MDRLYSIAQRWLRENGELFGGETLRSYDAFFERHIVPAFGERFPEVTEAQVRAFMEKKTAEGYSEASVYRMQRLLHRVLEYGAALGECPAPAWDLGLGAPKARKGAVILSGEDRRRLEQFLVDHPRPQHLGLYLILTLGLGIGEVKALKWKDVLFKVGRIRVPSRAVPFGERQRMYLKKLASQPEVYVASGKERPSTSLRDRFLRIQNELLLPPMTLMDLRRTYAVLCLEAGDSYHSLAKKLGLAVPKDIKDYYEELLTPEAREARNREYEASFAEKKRPEHTAHLGPDLYPEVVAVRRRMEAKRAELQEELDNLSFDLDIIRTLRNADCVQGQAREGLYRLVEKLLGPKDKDGQYLVEYMRCNMRVAAMPLRINRVASVQAIRRRVAHGFEKLCRRIEEIEAAADRIGTLEAAAGQGVGEGGEAGGGLRRKKRRDRG